MAEIFASPFFGIALSILAFLIGVEIRKRTGAVSYTHLDVYKRQA